MKYGGAAKSFGQAYRILLASLCFTGLFVSSSPSQSLLDGVLGEVQGRSGSDAIPIPSRSDLSSAETKRLQSTLANLGHYSGRIDGRSDIDTLIAVARWARAHGWEVPNIVRRAHLDFLEQEVGAQRDQTSASAGPAPANDLVSRIQSALNKLGYYNGPIDGGLDGGTKSALAAWAKDRGWAAPTTVRVNHAEHMEAEILSRGGTLDVVLGADTATVRRVQDALNRLGYYSGPIDGQVNPATAAALKAWAGDRGWEAPSTIRTAHAENMENEIKGGTDAKAHARARGKFPVVDEAVAWRADDTSANYIARLRAAAKAMGKACQDERQILEALGSDVSWQISDLASGRVNKVITVDWKGNSLTEQIPAWLIVSADKPIRFSGPGNMALGPNSPNPFGVAFGRGNTRALVLLPSRGAGPSGKILLKPLSAEKLKLTVSVVGYLRQCDEEIILKSETHALEIAPAAATVVLDTAAARAAYTHEIDIADQGRRLLLNESSFLLLDRASNTEIIRRGGVDLSLSPTHRFAVARQGETLEIIDVVDGATVAMMHDGDISWALGDSAVLTTHSPWAKVALQSTFGDMLRVNNITTGAACCTATPGETRVGVDLHNAFYAIEGNTGDKVGSLLQPSLATAGVESGGYSGEGTHPTENRTLITSLGLVAPISVDKLFDAEGGFRLVKSWFDSEVPGGSPNAGPRPFDDILTVRLAAVGLSAKKLASGSSPNTPSAKLSRDLLFQFDRIGIEIMPMNAGEATFDLSDPTLTHSLSTDDRYKVSEAAMERFKQEAIAAGWRFNWALPAEEQGALGDCYHVLMEQGNVAEEPLAPRDVVAVHRVETDKGAIWVARAECTAGATFGSLRNYHAIYFMDLAGPAPKKRDSLLTDGAFVFENNQQEDWWFQHPARIKANDSRLMTWAPNQGVITVWDRATQKFIWIGKDLPDGNLLAEAFLTKDGRHAIQLNTDASFRIYALSDGHQVLAGRLVDDEIAVWTNDHHYDATAEAATLIDIRFPGKPQTFSLDRFGATRAVSGLAKDILSAGIFPAMGEELGVPPDLAGVISLDSTGHISAQLKFDREKVSAIAVFQDGALTDTLTGDALLKELTVARGKGARWVSLLATDDRGLASLPVTADLGPAASGEAEHRLFVVGVNSYQTQNGLAPLSLPLRDAGVVIETLATSPASDAPSFAARGLKDRQATPGAILEGVKQTLDGLGQGDQAVLFFAGHGVRDEQGRFYFATADSNVRDLPGTALHFEDLTKLLADSPARVTVLLDTCHSGLAGNGLFATNDQLADGLQNLKSNITVVAAAKGRQESIGSAGGGLFTQAFRRVVRDERGKYDLDNNGRIEVRELYLGLQEIVSKESDGDQSPWIVNSRMVGNYALF